MTVYKPAEYSSKLSASRNRNTQLVITENVNRNNITKFFTFLGCFGFNSDE